MSDHRLLALVALALAGFCLSVQAVGIDFKNPVRSAAEDEIKSLPGLNYSLNFKHYSGYLNADDKKNRFWHYWFTESQSDPAKDPLVLWLNGGPGCSSLLGLLTELGPYSITAEGQVVENKFAWNKRANVIFLESPAGVGYSYAADGDITADDDTTATQNHRALQSFFDKFPQFKNRELYLTGESYGGVYLPTLAVLVDEDKSMNLKGVAIGNGYLDANKLAESLIFFSYYHGLVGRSTWKGLSTHCCDGKPPARGQCKFTDPTRTDKCSDYIKEATDAILESGLNPYNLYDRCAQPDTMPMLGARRGANSRENFDRGLLAHAFNFTSKPRSHLARLSSRAKFERPNLFTPALRGDPPCTDDAITINYLNRPEVKEAIHIPEGLKQEFTTCFDGIKYTMIYPSSKFGLAPQINHLLHSDRKLTLLVYNGDVDMMCNFIGDEWFVDDLNRKVIADYSPWHLNGQVAGFVKHYEGITYMTVKGSGHMVPTDKPAEALAMFEIFLFGHEKRSEAV